VFRSENKLVYILDKKTTARKLNNNFTLQSTYNRVSRHTVDVKKGKKENMKGKENRKIGKRKGGIERWNVERKR
jgi:hypothetical protein